MQEKEEAMATGLSFGELKVRNIERTDFALGFKDLQELNSGHDASTDDSVNNKRKNDPWHLQGFFKGISSEQEFEKEYEFLFPS